MIQVVPFFEAHLLKLKEQGSVFWAPEKVQSFAHLEKSWGATTILDEAGRILACGGIFEMYPGRGHAWAFFDAKRRDKFLLCHRVLRRFLNNCPYRRVEATVDCNFRAGHRLVKALGFELEAKIMKAYSPYGSDQAMYARIKAEE